jgi:hypothetical protein
VYYLKLVKPSVRDIIFLFGAGASYGAGSVLPEKPPLGFQLYSILEHVYPGTWGALPQNIKDGFRNSNNFEIGMKLVYEQFGGYIPILMRDMAIYFIQFRPYNKATLYCRLIEDIQKIGLVNRCLFSTLNYECLLEYSLLEHGLPISYFDDANLLTIPVWKLHGSCNMFSQSIQASQGVFYSTGVTWDGNVQAFLDPNKVIQHCLVETGLAPVMSLYMEGKILNVSPSVIKQLQQAWADRVSHANVLFLIGINPNVQDSHIWEPLAKSKAILYFIGDEKALENWKEARRAGFTEFLSDKFNIAYPSIVRRLNSDVTIE